MVLVNWILKYITQRIFRENQLNRFGTEDPYYEEYEVEQRSFFTGSIKTTKAKRKKALPRNLSQNDSNVLKRVVRRAYHLDMLFSLWGYRFGWNGLIGFIPIVGDIAGLIFSLLLFKSAREVDGGLPFDLQLKFIANILIDLVLGFIPIVGDLIEVAYKANSRNALLLEKHLEAKSALLVGAPETLDKVPSYGLDSYPSTSSSKQDTFVGGSSTFELPKNGKLSDRRKDL